METGCRKLIPWSYSLSSNHFTYTERTALQEFLRTLTFEELHQLLELLKTRCLISQKFYWYIREFYLWKNGNMNEMFTLLISSLSRRCMLGLDYILFALFNSGGVTFAQKLYNIYQHLIELFNKPVVIHKINTSGRKKIQVYFEKMKIHIQNMVFVDPADFFMDLSNKIRQKIYGTILCSEERILQEICDKYIVLLALTIDSLVNKTCQIDPDHQLFQDMEAIISMTSCPDLSLCLLYGRRAVVLSFANRKEEGEDLVREGLICADRVSSCLETVDMHYKIVLFLRVWYEHYPQIKTNCIFDHTQEALKILENEPEDVRMFWTRRFIFRLLCCFLGLGIRCRFIEHFFCPTNILKEAERLRLLDKYSSAVEYRLQMYFSIAKSRLWHLKGDNDAALVHLVKAKEIAEKGKYSELKNIRDAEQSLFLPDVSPLFIETENNNDIVVISITEPIHLPPSYHLPQNININDLHVSLTSQSNSYIPERGPEDKELEHNSDTSTKSEPNCEQNDLIPTEEPLRSHDFSREVIHIKSSKANLQNV